MAENPQAFPGVAHFTGAEHHQGMTLRDWFAGQVLVGFALSDRDSTRAWIHDDTASHCYAMADAMLIERERQP